MPAFSRTEWYRMGENTNIEWADHTWNPWRGCSKVSPGCAHCYAETLSKRNPAVLGEWGPGRPRVLAKNWGDPQHWNRKKWFHGTTPHRPRVFPSLCDWLDEEVPISWFARFLQLIHDTPNIDWLLLTKRPQNWLPRMRTVLADVRPLNAFSDWLGQWMGTDPAVTWRFKPRPPLNVWFGVSVEDQPRALERVPVLLKIPAVLRWLSLEPLLAAVQLEHLDVEASGDPEWCEINALTGRHTDMARPAPDVQRLDWLVIGGESGPCARPCQVEWVHSLLAQGQVSGVPVFVKQLGARPRRSCGCEAIEDRGHCPDCFDGTQPWVLRHPKGGDPLEWPEDLRIREWPSL